VAKMVTTVEEVRAAVKSIRACVNDYEMAHAKEDDLYEGVLRAVAAFTLQADAVGGVVAIQHLNELAKAALESKRIKFKRVCA